MASIVGKMRELGLGHFSRSNEAKPIDIVKSMRVEGKTGRGRPI